MGTYDVRYLVSDTHRQKARKKLEIKEFEAQLDLILTSPPQGHIFFRDAALLCDLLQHQYAELRAMLGGNPAHPAENKLNQIGESIQWQMCYESIKCSSMRLSRCSIEEHERCIVDELQANYHLLRDLLTDSNDAEEDTPYILPSDKHTSIKPLLEATTSANWLQAVVAFANQQAGICASDIIMQLGQLEAQQIQCLSDLCAQKEYLDLINAIFFYKLYPKMLFEKNLHPEKLISVTTRLHQLYDFIEIFYASLTEILIHKGLPAPQDYLFHGDELPPGIELKVNGACSALIIDAIKSWKFCSSEAHSPLNMNVMQEIIRAYKFWFNPSRLIDVVMNLQQKIIRQYPDVHPVEGLKSHLLKWYQSLSTTQCLDLYGYFSNKDSNYLMRTLIMVQQDGQTDWLPAMGALEIQAIQKVHIALGCVMDMVCITLNERQIHTQPYNHSLNKHKTLTPGRRIRSAILRVIDLYKDDELPPNLQLESLFSQLES